MSQISRTSSMRLLNINGQTVIDLDSDEEEDQSLPQNSQRSFASRPSLATTDVIELEDSDDEDLDPARALRLATSSTGDLPVLLGFQNTFNLQEDGATLVPSSSTGTKKRKNESESGGTKKKRKTSDEIARDRELKTREKEAEKQRKKEEREAEKLRVQAQKAQDKTAQQAEKEANKRHAEANRVIKDKKSTLSDCKVEASNPTEQHPVFGQWLRIFGNRLRENSSDLSYKESKYSHPYTMQWKRRIDKEYDEKSREWQAIDTPYHVFEPVVALFYTAEELIKKLGAHRNQVMEDIGMIKMEIDEEFLRLGSDIRKQRSSKNYQIYIIITGVQTYCKGRSKEHKDAFDAFSIRVNVHHRAHVITCETRHELAQRLHDLSADLGIKPHKLIRNSHLPYVSDTTVKPGSTLKETYKEMLMKIYKFTDPVAKAVISHKPTLNQLMLAYDKVGDQGQRELLFEQVTVRRQTQPTQPPKVMNVSLSKRLHKTTFGLNPYAFVGPDTAADMHH